MTLTAAMRELAERMTPGPWKLIWHGNEKYPFPLSVHAVDDTYWVTRDGVVSREANARAIALADLVPRLVEMVERQQEELRLIRMKDCAAVYDVSVRVETTALLTEISKRLEQKP